MKKTKLKPLLISVRSEAKTKKLFLQKHKTLSHDYTRKIDMNKTWKWNQSFFETKQTHRRLVVKVNQEESSHTSQTGNKHTRIHKLDLSTF